MGLVFDSKTGKVVFKEDIITDTQTVAEKISFAHKSGRYSTCRDRITKKLKETIKEGKAKYNFRPIRCVYGNTGIILDFKNVRECSKYFNSPISTVKYHLYRGIDYNGWKVQFKEENIK